MTDNEKLQQFLENAKHMVLAVTLDDGMPWAVPVKIQEQHGRVFEWDSKLDTVHSQAIAGHPDAAIVIFTKDQGNQFGFYAKGRAEEVLRRPDGYGRYRFTARETWINDQTFTKRKVELG